MCCVLGQDAFLSQGLSPPRRGRSPWEGLASRPGGGRDIPSHFQEAQVQTLPLPLFQYTCLHILHTFATQGQQFRCMWVYSRVTTQGWVVQSWVKITQSLCEF